MTVQAQIPEALANATLDKVQERSLNLPSYIYFAIADIVSAVVAVTLFFFGPEALLGLSLAPETTASAPLWDIIEDLAAFLMLLLMLFVFGGLYSPENWEAEELLGISAAVGVSIFACAALRSNLGFDQSILFALAAWVLIVGIMFCARMASRALPMVRRAMTAPIVVIGRGVSKEEIRGQLKESRASIPRVVSQLSCDDFLNFFKSNPARGAQFFHESTGAPVERLTFVILPDADEMPNVVDIVETLSDANLNYMVAMPFDGLARMNVTLRKVVGGDIVFAEVKAREPSIISLTVKRVLDVMIAGGALITLSPILLVIAGLIATSRGPIMFSQKRVGRNRKRFECLKFRSMVVDAAQRLEIHLAENPEAKKEWETYQKLSKDPRITPIGRVLRKTSLDELPQLINVLRGDMSIVGPRPIVAPETPGYPSDKSYFDSEEFEYYAKVRPGITGLWQVSGRASTTHAERVRLDRWYARNWSIWLDLVIFLKTARAAILGTGSS